MDRTLLKCDTLPIYSEADIVLVRKTVRAWTAELKFSVVDQTKLITAASEIARNTLIYGKGGTVRMEQLEDGTKTGIRLTFKDEGPGIDNLEQALVDGFTSGKGLGLGLSGSKRLV